MMYCAPSRRMLHDVFFMNVYRALWLLALPLAALRLVWRAAKDKSYRAHWPERFGFALPRGPFAIWIHAVSVGETRAAEPFIKELRKRDANIKILLTHMTPTGRATGAQLFGQSVTQCFLPYDFLPLTRRFLNATQPARAVVMETELWPEVIAQCAQRGIPAWLVNARLSEKSARGYAKFPNLTHITLNNLRGILAAAPADAARFEKLGARNVQTLGNMKFDVTPPADYAQAAAALRTLFAQCGNKPIWIAGSTREGDEALLLDALRTHALRSSARALIVPRHPQRFDEVFALAQSKGFVVAKRSEIFSKDSEKNDQFAPQVSAAEAEIIIGDSMGEMFAYYAVSQVAFMGGSFSTGSQNLIEPCAVGVPVVLGPSIFNFEAAAKAAIAKGAAQQVASAEAALDAIQALIDHPAVRSERAASAQRFAQDNRGATIQTFEHVFKEVVKKQAPEHSKFV
jgi:3-deoxy-D-manno-octulosonic-acid transferase